MIQSLKTIKNRIRSIENTRKVTAAMELISVAKLNRIERPLLLLRPYVAGLEKLTQGLIAGREIPGQPFLETGRAEDKTALCVITSDSGLCGSYNNNIIRLAEEFIRRCGQGKVTLVCLGKKGFNYFRKKGMAIEEGFQGANGRYSEKLCQDLNSRLQEMFLSGKAAQVHVAYTHFKTALVHIPSSEKFLNIDRLSGVKKDHILEPDRQAILAELVPRYLYMKLKLWILEAFTAEHSARTMAMKTATDNAQDLLQGLVLMRNKVRQANITQEIMEIISSSEALKG